MMFFDSAYMYITPGGNMAFKTKTKLVKKPVALVPKTALKDVQRTSQALNKQKRAMAKIKTKNAVNKVQHQKKVDKLKRKAELAKIKAEAKLATPKNVARKEAQKFALEKLKAGERVQIAKYQHQWKNTLAGGLSASANVQALTDSSGGSIQDEISKALGGYDKSSLPGSKPEEKPSTPQGEVTK